MRDCKLFYEEGFDIDFSADGEPVYTDTEGQTNDQRAAVACVITKGTIPGAADVGADWSNLYSLDDKSSVVGLDNQCKQMLENCVSSDGQMTNQYIPLYIPQEDGSVAVTTMKGVSA